MRRSIHEPRKNGPDSNVRALADRWKSDAERYRKYAETGPNPALHQAIAQTLINAADELNGALAQDHRARLLREVEAEWEAAQHTDDEDESGLSARLIDRIPKDNS
ncbi:MAG: hypothetical protein ACRDPS_21980 [Nocardioides sp.]|uniref:hypothetical protein n=1 Tax=Nocardioides sp. TaxID=35761 RepID=UPI003D6AD5E6